MGNYRFKLSDMIPNAWFYKLKEMGRTRKQNPTRKTKKQQSLSSSNTQHSPKQPKQQPHQCNPRKSYYFTRELSSNNPNKVFTTSPTNNNNNIKNQNVLLDTNFPQPPRKSSKQRPKRRTQKTSSSSPPLEKNYSSEEESKTFPDPEIRTDRVLLPTFDDDIIIDVDNNSIARKDGKKLNEYENEHCFSELMILPPIVTKPEKFNDLLEDAKKKEKKPRNRMAANEEKEEEQNLKGSSLRVKILKDEKKNNNISGSRRISLSSPSVRLRINSPRIGVGGRKAQANGRKSVSSSTGSFRRSLSESLAIVKSSDNPQSDFRESMVEMIVQNNIRSSKDLEDLLACYLSLNLDEYHDLIINVFKQIWFDLTDNQ